MNPLVDILPTKYRKIAYALLAVASVVFTIWQASDGDWRQFAGGLLVALFGATAASNAKTPE